VKIALGGDHGGFELKEEVRLLLEELGIEYKDFGTYSKDSVNYADYGIAVAEAVSAGEYDRGIVICGTGIGISITANKVKGIRCALVSDIYSAKVTRLHNDSNVLALGGRTLGVEIAREIVKTWIETPFEGGRHQARIDAIANYENK
jgi:ribose 5-phosphate isomerase B